MLDANTAKVAKSLFKKYYQNVEFKVDNIANREFGFGDFEKKIAFRHYSFKDPQSLKKYVVENVPIFLNFSSALYKYPDAQPMEKKMWLGSELIFDLDANDLNLKCQSEHGRNWVCDNCLSSVKNETIKLIEDFLVPDFGFSKNEISVNFSGNRGYHVRVNNKDVVDLTSEERRGISGYISGIDIDISAFFPTLGQKGKRLVGPKPGDYGWGGKLARGIVTALNLGTDSLVGLGMDSKMAKKLEASKADVIFGITTGNWDKINIPRKAEFWSSVLKHMAISQSKMIDKNVTNDVGHLIRMPNTIHGDTGLLGKTVSISELDRFDPMRESVIFKDGTLNVSTGIVPRFYMYGNEYGPYSNSNLSIPTYAALYISLKRLGRIVYS